MGGVAIGKYSLAKRIVHAVPGLREFGASAFVLLPVPLSTWTYRAMRKTVFHDNENRVPAFRAAFALFTGWKEPVSYLEFGVARGTSVITADVIARSLGLTLRIFAFDSFRGLPSGEGPFSAGDMAYSEPTFRRFIRKAGVDTSSVTSIPGMFDETLTPATRERLGLDRRRYVVHIDCDLYESARVVLGWLEPVLATGSVLIFDDWFSFENEPDPDQHGERRAFGEWPDRGRWKPLHVQPAWNVALVRG